MDATKKDGLDRQLLDLLEETTKLHMISDVPIGVLLSGGVDSVAMLSFAVGKTDKSISSYTIGFSSNNVVDERPFARLAAEKFGSKHHEISLSPIEFRDFLPSYVWYMEDPICEPPAIALYYVSKLASQDVKVLISGEGGDEAFAGYPNYRNFLMLENLKSILGPLSGHLGIIISAVGRALSSPLLKKYGPLMGMDLESYYYSRSSTPLHFFNREFVKFYTKDFARSISKEGSQSVIHECMKKGSEYGALEKMLYVDTKTWLPDDLLIKADKMTMANSVELRVPFLDHKVLEFAASLPRNQKVRGWKTKYLAKKALRNRVPKEILGRPKAGFPVPYESWLRKDLRNWLRDILFDRRTLDRGYFEKSCLEFIFSENLRSGEYSKEIFSLAVLELWHREFLEGEGIAPTPIPSGRGPIAVG
jgi:asparagine synthase (glutamine-hydrolysing)